MPKTLLAGLGIVFLLCLGAIIPSVWLPYDPLQPSTDIMSPPSSIHLLGTTDLGEDVWSQVVEAIKPSLLICSAVGLGTVGLGFLLASLAVLAGGLVDRIILRLADIMLALPNLVVMMMIASLVRPGIWVLILVLILLDWHGEVRQFRAKIQEEMGRDTVDVARICRASWFYLIRRHLVPETAPLLAVRFVQNGRRAVFKFAGLSFLGLTDPHMVSWGGMLNRSMGYLNLDAWQWWLLPPAAALSLLLISLYLIGSYIEQKIFIH